MDRYAEFIYRNNQGKEILFSVDSNLWLTDVKGMSDNKINVKGSNSVNQIGETVTALSVSPKDITLEGTIEDNIEATRIDLISTITPLDRGKLIYRRKDKEYYLDVTPISTPYISNGSPTQNFQIVLHAAFPYWKATDGKIQYISGMIPSFKFPINYSKTHYFGVRVKSQFINIYNEGNASAGFKCVFISNVFPVKNPSILNVVTGEKFKLNYEMQPNEKIEISTYWGDKRITLYKADGTTENIFRYRSEGSTFFQLQPGDNIFKDDAEKNDKQMDTYISFENTYVGV